jgi:hypothetical protein
MTTNNNPCLEIAGKVLVSSGAGKVKKDFISKDELLRRLSELDVKNKHYVLLIVGPSGSGKSWLSAQIQGFMPFWHVLHLDEFRERVGSSLDINFSKLESKMTTKPTIIEGNTSKISQLLSVSKADEVIFVVPDPEVFKKSNELKFVNGPKKGIPDSILQYFKKNAAMSVTDFARFFIREVSLFAKHSGSIPFTVVCMTRPKEVIREGWHASKSDQVNPVGESHSIVDAPLLYYFNVDMLSQVVRIEVKSYSDALLECGTCIYPGSEPLKIIIAKGYNVYNTLFHELFHAYCYIIYGQKIALHNDEEIVGIAAGFSVWLYQHFLPSYEKEMVGLRDLLKGYLV